MPYVLLAAGCILSLGASWHLSALALESARARAHAEFLGDAQQLRRQIQLGLHRYLEVVRSGAVLVSAENEISAVEFRRFVEGLELADRYPGLRGLGFAPCLSDRQVGDLVRALALDGSPVRPWPVSGHAVRCPLVFFEPRADNTDLLGLDLGSVPALARAMDDARDAGRPVATGPLTGVQPLDRGGSAVAVLLPVYRDQPAPASIETRRAALLGFIFSPLVVDRLLDDLAPLDAPMRYEVYDGSIPSPERLLVRSAGPRVDSGAASHGVVRVAGRDWLVAVHPPGVAVRVEPEAAEQALLGGLLLSVMLFLITRAQARAWETAARHEEELRASAEALREREAQAHAANRAKDEFLATLSHELRTPLNVILGWAALLRQAPHDESRIAHALEIIERNARQQAQLIDDLLDVSRIVTGKLRLDRRPVPFAPLVASVVDALRPGADAKGLTIALGQLAPTSTVMGDADRLRQTVWNLISNAIKFTPSGGTIFVDLTRSEHYVRLCVRDTGIGIDPEFLPHVFERFRQADSSTTRVHNGLGLGLAIVRDLVELHGGSIDAQSDGRDRGATFIVTLPAAPASVPVVAVTTTPARAPALDGLRILVVDDDPHTLDLLTTALGTTGAAVASADSAERALEQLTRQGADVIVSDIAMPGEDGLWLMRRVRRLPGKPGRTPAIALTALARSEDRVRVLGAGYQLHLTKPVQLDELQRCIARLAAREGDAPPGPPAPGNGAPRVQ